VTSNYIVNIELRLEIFEYSKRLSESDYSLRALEYSAHYYWHLFMLVNLFA